MKKKILLVNPENFSLSYGDVRFVRFLTKKSGGILNATLPTIAALTPDEFEVDVVDEKLESINFAEKYDIVGISAIVTQFGRAIEIAKEFSKRGSLVVCGGSSVSLSPERWRPYADVLIIGEAERIWPQFLADYLSGHHKKEYHETERFDLAVSPVPDYSHIPKHILNQYTMGIVQTSRGCPYNCEFCDVINYVGRKMRYKSIDTVMAEIEQLKSFGIPFIFLADDNFSAGREKATKILQAIQKWNRAQKEPITFSTQLSIDTARDKNFLKLAAESGLLRVVVGIESPNVESLKEARKYHNLQNDMIEDLKAFHEHGIMVLGTTIVGFDHDDLNIFQQHLDFHKHTGIPNIQVYPLQAPDGSALRERMIQEGRYRDWQTQPNEITKKRNNFSMFTIVPQNMTTEQLRQGTLWLLKKLYENDNFFERYKTFFDHFEASQVKSEIRFLKKSLNMHKSLVLLKFIKYFILKATREERIAILRFFRYAGKSTHPEKLIIPVFSFIMLKNTQEMLKILDPNIDNITYPQRSVNGQSDTNKF